VLPFLASMIVFGGACTALVARMCSRSSVWSRRAGVLMACAIAVYFGGVAVVLVIGSLSDGTSLRLAGSLTVTVFASITCGAVMGARRGLLKK